MDDKQVKQVNTYFGLVAALALGVLATGTVFYHFVEKLSWLNAYYFSVITLTTVGYGDITPHTSLGKIFTTFYVLMGIGIIGLFANLLIRRAAINTKERREKRKK
ncbi:two pore domain potassium channel family protein [Candidatus Saccharibacteria bacterium]|nr:two pore domain potassium channel family protein [Candidatus Saccharibacteria bacterium]